MSKPLVIIHGYNDGAESFSFLKEQLRESEIASTITTIDLAHYVTMDDSVTFDDLAHALMFAWKEHGISLEFRSVNVIAHSMGALLVRHFLQTFFNPKTVPVEHLVLLAPANFGSTLAHKGRAFLGRVVNGFRGEKPFEVGDRLLQGMELGSPFTYELAMLDRLGKENIYKEGAVLCTTLVGNTGFDGIEAAANSNGSDGNVRISTANMNCDHLHIDFSQDPFEPMINYKTSRASTGFAVMHLENHATITGKDEGFRNQLTWEFIKEALTIDDEGFATFSKKLYRMSTTTMERTADKLYTQGYQNTVFYVKDHLGNEVSDYFIELFAEEKSDDWFTSFFQHQVIETVHSNRQNGAFKTMLINCTLLHENLEEMGEELYLSIFAQPNISTNKTVGYRTYGDDDIGALVFNLNDIRKYFKPNRTLFITITLKREQSNQLVRF